MSLPFLVDSVNELAESVKAQAEGALVEYREISVVDAVSYTAAGQALVLLKQSKAEILEVFDPIVEERNGAWKRACNARNIAVAGTVALITALDSGMTEYNRQQSRAKEAADKKAADDFKRESDARNKELADRAKLAEEASKSGDTVLANEIMAVPVKRPPLILPAPVEAAPQVDGLTVAKGWKAEIRDEVAFDKAVLAGTVPGECYTIKPSASQLNKYARKFRKVGEMYPGIDCVEDFQNRNSR